MIVGEMKEADRSTWDAYVQSAPCGLPYHLSGWREVLARTYGYETHFLMATEGERVAGVLPLFIVHSFLVGSRAMTMMGGLCTGNDDVALALIARGKEVATQAGVKQLVLQDSRRAWPGDLQTSTHHVDWVVDVRAGPDALWKKLHRNVRRQVRMAHEEGLTVEIVYTEELLDEFYDVLSHFTHQAGTPVFGRNFLQHVVEAFPNRFSIAIVFKGKKPVGGYFQLVMGNTVYGTWGATLREYQKLRPTHLAYWELICDTAERGYHYLNLGRSPANSNTSRFKGQWSTVSKPIYQQVVGIGKHQTTASITKRVGTDAKYQRFTRLWPKLPFPIAQFLGPKLRYHVPFA